MSKIGARPQTRERIEMILAMLRENKYTTVYDVAEKLGITVQQAGYLKVQYNLPICAKDNVRNGDGSKKPWGHIMPVIRQYFEEHPGHTYKQCAEATGLTTKQVRLAIPRLEFCGVNVVYRDRSGVVHLRNRYEDIRNQYRHDC